jgi:GGDEF domain-containing protein
MSVALRRTIGRLFGYQQEIDELTRKVREMSWDDVFGMWTRAAFLQFCRIMPRGERAVALLDLDRVHDLNARLGYAEVDRRVKASFSIPLRSSDIVARWYSGDEIVILFDGGPESAAAKLEALRESAQANGITFAHESGTWSVGRQDIVEVVSALAARMAPGGAGDAEAGSGTGTR